MKAVLEAGSYTAIASGQSATARHINTSFQFFIMPVLLYDRRLHSNHIPLVNYLSVWNEDIRGRPDPIFIIFPLLESLFCMI